MKYSVLQDISPYNGRLVTRGNVLVDSDGKMRSRNARDGRHRNEWQLAVLVLVVANGFKRQ